MNRRDMIKASVAAMVAPTALAGATLVPHRIPDGTTHGGGKTELEPQQPSKTERWRRRLGPGW